MKKVDSSLESELGLAVENDGRIGPTDTYRRIGANSEGFRQR
jgi:hypothetical protein